MIHSYLSQQNQGKGSSLWSWTDKSMQVVDKLHIDRVNDSLYHN